MPRRKLGRRRQSAPPEIVQMGDHPVLAQTACEVTEADWPQIPALIERLTEALRAHKGQALSAPQVGVGLRVCIIETRRTRSRPEARKSPRYVLVNPVITWRSQATEIGMEGCLSFYDGGDRIWRADVERHTQIKVAYHDEHGQAHCRKFGGLVARAVQHECDHLDGITFPDRALRPAAKHWRRVWL